MSMPYQKLVVQPMGIELPYNAAQTLNNGSAVGASDGFIAGAGRFVYSQYAQRWLRLQVPSTRRSIHAGPRHTIHILGRDSFPLD